MSFNGSIYLVGLNTPNDKQADLIHPNAMENVGNLAPFFKYTLALLALVYLEFGSRIVSQRKAPVLCAVLHGALYLRLTIRLHMQIYVGTFNMIYTFLIARSEQKLSQIKRLRFISAVGNSETEARNSLSGLPLVLVSRKKGSRS